MEKSIVLAYRRMVSGMDHQEKIQHLKKLGISFDKTYLILFGKMPSHG